MIQDAFIVPHSPILIPAIGKANIALLQKTAQSYAKLAEKIISLEPELIVIISPHSQSDTENFTINISPKMMINFEEFGDFATKNEANGDIALAHELKEALRSDYEIKLTTQERLDYGSAIPYHLLTENYKKVKVLPLAPSTLDIANHYEFGKKLGDFLINRPEKILIIASADLSHRLKRRSIYGYSPKGAKFDNKLIEYLSNPENAAENILKMDANLVKEAMSCGLKSIILSLGIISRLEYQPQVLSYQGDLGIGYLALDFNIDYAD
ncbi:MAG TPA: class III extradiol dioxygenase subunit B-like domain-containing protein [bacterium]|nr:class III extradiol dioxygenase subunit B-like domain-containing protein [bacterium]HPT30144.1 class III extradiol dioxygenase subunit B-like domain-containing protein [bacterium]